MIAPFNAKHWLVAIWLVAGVCASFAQPGVKELPIVTRPRERSTTERVTVATRPVQPSKGVLAVVLSQYVNAQVVIKDSSGRVLETKDAGEEGQAEFQLRRGKVYQIEASHPDYRSVSSKSKLTGATSIVRLDLVPLFASLKFSNLPDGAQVFIDETLRATADKDGGVTVEGLAPGDHSLAIRHPEYNDYADSLRVVEAGVELLFARIPLTRVAKLRIEGPAGATILIDGAVQGKINPDGLVRIDYEIERASERTITVELLGYHPWSKRESLSPGPRTITVKLDPIVTSAGVSDLFENLSLWKAPSTWKVVSDSRNRKLEVRGDQLGLLSDKTYRDFGAAFKLWLDDGKGATWAVRVDKECRNYYLFHLAGPNSSTHTPRRFYTYLVKDGAAPIEINTPFPVLADLNQKSSYTVEIRVEGHEIRQWITDDLNVDTNDLGILTDTSATKEKFLYGSFGFRSFSGEIFTVDDLTLTLDLANFRKQ